MQRCHPTMRRPWDCCCARWLTSTDTAVGTAAKHDPWCRSGMTGVLNNQDAIDDDSCARAARILVGVSVSCLVAEIACVKDCDVAAVSFGQQPTVTKFERLRRSAGH